MLAGRTEYRPSKSVLLDCAILPAAERRRATDAVKLALTVCNEAMHDAAADLTKTSSVFASSGGDGATITAILELLSSAQRELSPTRFHNSVHNAPAGYWSIAARSQETSTSLCAHDFSFTAGLLEAACQSLTEQRAVLMAAYDLRYPPALDAVRPINDAFGVALVLSPHQTKRSIAGLSIMVIRQSRPATTLSNPVFEALRTGNPAARSLPLLFALAQDAECEVVIPYVAGNYLALGVRSINGPQE